MSLMITILAIEGLVVKLRFTQDLKREDMLLSGKFVMVDVFYACKSYISSISSIDGYIKFLLK